LRRKRQLRLEACAIQLAADQLVLAEQATRRLDPAGPAIERPAARGALRVLVGDEDGALVRGLCRQAEVGGAAQFAVTDRGTGRRKAGHAGQALRAAERLDEPLEYLFGRGLSVFLADRVVEFDVGCVVPGVERDGRRRRDAAMMAGPARHALHAAEIRPVD